MIVKEDKMKEKGYVLKDNEGLLRSEWIFDGTQLWMQSLGQTAFAEIERVKNEIEVQFTSPEDPTKFFSVVTSKKETLRTLKESISKVIHRVLNLNNFLIPFLGDQFRLGLL